MKQITSYQKRVQKVKSFVDHNKLFTLIAVTIIVLLLCNFLFGKDQQTESKVTETVYTQSDTIEETEPLQEQWQFYWIDLWILAGGGGFCTVMIIRERKKAREELQ